MRLLEREEEEEEKKGGKSFVVILRQTCYQFSYYPISNS